jgi:thimet oligopeptidase
MKRAVAWLAGCAVFCAGAADVRPLVKLWDAAQVTKACDDGLAKARKTVAAMERQKGAGAIFDEWNRLQMALEDFANPIYLLGSVHPEKPVRDASEPCLQKYTTFSTELFQNEKLFRRVSAAKPANAHQAKLRKDLLEGFEDSGVALSPDKRKRAKEIFDRLELLRQDFDRNIREDPTKVSLTAAEVEGMPESWLKAQEKNRDPSGNYSVGLDYPTYFPFMQNAKNEEARKRFFIAKNREGGEQNLERLYEIFKLRKELAGLYGLPTFADYALRRKMVGDAKTVDKFLADVRGAILELEKKEIEDLRAEKARDRGTSRREINDTGTPLADTRLYRWDVRYYTERVRKARYAIDQEKLRKYFPVDRSIAWSLLIAQKLYGVKFAERKVPVWHPDVQYFDVLDAKTGRYVSGFYLDLYPREGKFAHVAAFPIRGVSTRAGRTPLSALVGNFAREGLDHNELETMLHEFGHVLHGVLSKAEYNPHAGTSVKGDFVEAPSQMFEEWARRAPSLALFKQVCPECPQLSADEIQRLDAARKYGQGIFYTSQWLYASYDMALSKDPQPVLAVWKQLEASTPLGHVEGTMFPAAFNHIASNYAAGYYGYMWSQVIALDMLSAFQKDLLDPKVGARYRDTILSQGGQVEEMQMVRMFLGREPSSDAFFAEITGRR